MNAKNAAISIDEKCRFKYVHAGWAFKGKMSVCMAAFGYSVCIQKPVACLGRSEVPLCLRSPVSHVSLHNANIVLIVCNVWQQAVTTNCFQLSPARADPWAVTTDHTSSPAPGRGITNPSLLLLMSGSRACDSTRRKTIKPWTKRLSNCSVLLAKWNLRQAVPGSVHLLSPC